MDEIAILIPCYNESKIIKKVIEDWKYELPNSQIYVYDNICLKNTMRNNYKGKDINIEIQTS